MCFSHNGDETVLSVTHARARVAHRCYDCWGAINPGELYLRQAWAMDASITVAKLCDRCQWLVARIYAEEIAEGCRPGESWPPIGGGELESEYRERTWYLNEEREARS